MKLDSVPPPSQKLWQLTTVFASLLLANLVNAQVWQEKEGVVIMEAERMWNENRAGSWAVRNANDIPWVDPLTKSTKRTDYYFVDGAKLGKYLHTLISRTGDNGTGTQGRMNYAFNITTPGRYRFIYRANIDGGHSDFNESNDVWLRVRKGTTNNPGISYGGVNDGWMKVHTNSWERRNASKRTRVWHHESRLGDKALTYDFNEPGTYRLQISARSKGFSMDRFIYLRQKEDSDAQTGYKSYNWIDGFGLVTNPRNQYKLDNLPESEFATPKVSVTGERQQWHKHTVTLSGPQAQEEGGSENPFLDYRMTITFSNGNETIVAPGYYAADGDAANTSATSGNQWQAHFIPTKTGVWYYEVDFRSGKGVALSTSGTEVPDYDGQNGSIHIEASDKTGQDFRSPGKGKLQYTGKAYPEWAGGDGLFLKAEANVPEVFLQYADFDGTNPGGRNYTDHVQHWMNGDPTWENGKGKGIIGAVNYLASLGINAQYFLSMNVEGDGERTYPYPHNWKRLDYLDDPDNLDPTFTPLDMNQALNVFDVSKLAQWQIVFDHMISKGIMPHLVFTEQENQSLFEYYANLTKGAGDPDVTFADSRKLFYRELIARFGYLNAITWNMGEENGWQTNNKYGKANTAQQRIDFANYVKELLPYQADQVVIHNPINGPGDTIFSDLLNNQNYTGISHQNYYNNTSGHDRINHWRNSADNSNRSWIISYDEPYAGEASPTLGTWRQQAVWGAFTAGAAGAGFYNNKDLSLQNYATYASYYQTIVRATEFLHTHIDDLSGMNPDDSLVRNDNWCLAKPGHQYLVYLPAGGTTNLDLRNIDGTFEIKWFDPRNGGSLQDGSKSSIIGQARRGLGDAPNNTDKDWAILITKTGDQPAPTNRAPVAFSNMRYQVNQDLVLKVNAPGILGNDYDLDGDPITAIKLKDPANGTLTFNENGSFIYRPNIGFTGTDRFTYKATDGDLESNVATVQITVKEVIHRTSAKIRTGEITATEEWQTITLPARYSKKVITTSLINTQDNPPLIARLRNRGPNQFDIKVQRFDGLTEAVQGIPVFWMVMEAGQYSAAQTGVKLEAHMITSRVTDAKASWVGQRLPYQQIYNQPVILGQVISYNDSNPSVFWNRGNSQISPASSTHLFVGKHVGADTNQARKNEVIGVIAIEAGSGILKTEDGDMPFEAKLGSDTIEGITDGSHTYSLSIQAEKAFINQSAEDGGDGGWAVHQARPSTSLTLAIDEDQLVDSERSHTHENVGYLALGEPAKPQTSFYAGINLNGDSVTIDGNTWLSMNEARRNGLRIGANTLADTTAVIPIDGAGAASMLQTYIARTNNNLYLSYPVSNGDYEVYLYTMHHDATMDGRFDLLMEGLVTATDVGIANTEAAGTWQQHGPFDVSVTNDILNVTLGSNLYSNQDSDPQLMGISILRR